MCQFLSRISLSFEVKTMEFLAKPLLVSKDLSDVLWKYFKNPSSDFYFYELLLPLLYKLKFNFIRTYLKPNV